METTTKKPIAKLLGADGNVFVLMGICSKALKRAGLNDEAKEMIDKIYECSSYDEALQIMMEYCDVR